MIISRLALLALCLFLCTCVSAQKIWTEGSYTLKDGTTASGQIPDTYDGLNIISVPFRKNEGAREKLIALPTLAAFSNATNRYIVREIKINTSPRDVKNLVIEANKTSSQATGALLLLLKTSSFSLYEYIDTREQNQYFLKTPEEELIYLAYARYLRENDAGGSRIHNYDAYKVVLNKHLGASPNLLPIIQKMNYKRSELVDLLVAYSKAQNETIEYNRPKPASIFRFAALAAVGASNHRLINATSTVGNTPVYNWENNFVPTIMIGGAISTVTNEQSPIRFSFELNYLTSRGKAAEDLPDDGRGRKQSREREISESRLEFRFGARYRVLDAKVPIYLEAGIMGVRFLNFYEQASFIREFGTTRRTIEFDKGVGRGLSGGLLTEFGRVEIGLRYDNVRSANPKANLFTNRFFLIAHYGLN